jgi:predicted O-methyltransferase YrrM
MRPELQDLPAGWFHHGEKILALVEAHRPRVCVELGTHKGASAIGLTRLLRTWGGHLVCVDSWNPVFSGEVGVLAVCAANLQAAGVAPWVRLIVATTAEAAAAWRDAWIDYLYIDADHSREGCAADLAAWWPHVRDGGLVAGDDYDNPDSPGVAEAWDAFERAHGQTFERFATPNTAPLGMRLVYGTKRSAA